MASRLSCEGGRRSEEEVEFTEEQIAYALRLADTGTPVVDVCPADRRVRSHVLIVETEVSGVGAIGLRRLKMLEDEKARLKRIVADRTPDEQILQESPEKSSEGCQAARAGSLDARALPSECAAVVPSGAADIHRSGTPRARHAITVSLSSNRAAPTARATLSAPLPSSGAKGQRDAAAHRGQRRDAVSPAAFRAHAAVPRGPDSLRDLAYAATQ